MNILIVDDCKRRSHEIRSLLIKNCSLSDENILIVHNANAAKRSLKNKYFDILILDVILPNRDETPSSDNGLNLLKQISDSSNEKLITPRKIIGITANKDDIATYREQFEAICSNIVEATAREPLWKNKLINAISLEKRSRIALEKRTVDSLCIVIHGIRTHAKWQQRFKKIVNSELDNVSFQIYKYGRFSTFSFFVPFFRLGTIYRFKKQLKILCEENSDKDIYIFAHSFGTYVLFKSLGSLLDTGCLKNLKLVVLAGSVLRVNSDFNEILSKTDVRIVNECGSRDYVLNLSEAFVPNTGMAGKVGISGMNNDRFCNRFFIGGHSHYFNEDGDFMERNWSQLFYKDNIVTLVDERSDATFGDALIDSASQILGKFKHFVYVALLFYGLSKILIP